MLKQLRFKFVIINMTLVTIMLTIIFGMILYQTKDNLESQCIQMLQSVSVEPFPQNRPGADFGNFRLPYFTVQLDQEGEIVSVDSGFYDLSDEQYLKDIVLAATVQNVDVGVLEDYNLRFCKGFSFTGENIVFADITSEIATMRNLFRTCLAIGVLSFAGFLFISLQLAKWAVKPVDQAWQQQKQFVADASHELKTPLTVIMTNAELLQNPEYDESARDHFTSSILTMSHQMRGLVEGLLDLARVDNGAVKTAFAPVDMSALVEEACMVFEPLYFEKGLSLESTVWPEITLRGSDSHLQQVLKILLDNAMKYSEAGTISVVLTKQSNHCLLTVENPGPPISQEDLKNIFKRFYRVDKARQRDGSYGLGLSIAENIVQEHRGRIWAESADGYNRFHVQLPAGN